VIWFEFQISESELVRSLPLARSTRSNPGVYRVVHRVLCGCAMWCGSMDGLTCLQWRNLVRSIPARRVRSTGLDRGIPIHSPTSHSTSNLYRERGVGLSSSCCHHPDPNHPDTHHQPILRSGEVPTPVIVDPSLRW
jgi:hypothetical protein